MLTIEKLREEINKTDAEIIKKLAERERLSKQIGELKAQNGKEVFDAAREQQLMNYYETLSRQHQLNAEFVKSLFELILKNSRNLQLQ